MNHVCTMLVGFPVVGNAGLTAVVGGERLKLIGGGDLDFRESVSLSNRPSKRNRDVFVSMRHSNGRSEKTAHLNWRAVVSYENEEGGHKAWASGPHVSKQRIIYHMFIPDES